jgi:hypothetical protein
MNRGWHRLFTGGRYDSFLVVPVVEWSGASGAASNLDP